MRSFLRALFAVVICAGGAVEGVSVSGNGTSLSGSSAQSTSSSPTVTTSFGSDGTSLISSQATLSNSNGTSSLNCSGIWHAWYTDSVGHVQKYTTYTTTWTYYNMTASTTTLCDGIPRVVGARDALTTIASGLNSTLTSEHLNYTVPTPTCQLMPQDCKESWNTLPPCETMRTTDCGKCTIVGQSVDLKYFPVTAAANATRDLCPPNGAGPPTTCPLGPTGKPYSVSNPYMATPCDYITKNHSVPAASGPYIVSAGHTLYKNRVYYQLDTIYATNDCGAVGSTHYNSLLTLQSTEVYSVGGYHHAFHDIGYQVDFRDFTSVPQHAYYMHADIVGPAYETMIYDKYRISTDFLNGASTVDFGGLGHEGTSAWWMWDYAYRPSLLMPLQVRSLDPAWHSCSLNLLPLSDPPIALTQALTAAQPTMPNDPQTTDAAPASSPKSQGAPATADPKPTATAVPPSPSDPDEDEPAEDGDDDDSSPEDHDPSNGDEPQPTVPDDPSPTQQEPAQSEVLDPSPTEGDAPASPQPSENDPAPSDDSEGDSPASPQPSDNDEAPEDSGADSPDSSQPSEEDGQSPADPDDEPQNPDQATTQPDSTFDPEPTSADQPQDSAPEGESDGSDLQDDSPALSPTTTGGLGGIIASVFSMDPAPAPTPQPATTTTNALSVLQSAAESFGGGNGPAQTGDQAAPDDQLPSIVGGSTPQQTFEPITVSNNEQTHTLQPVEGSAGLFTIAPPALSATASSGNDEEESPDEPPNDALPTEPIILTDHSGDTQTVNPIADSPGLYSMVPANPTSPSDSVPTAAFTGPATYVAGGEMHTIRPVESTSGVYVVDGSRTVTRVAPSAGVGSGSGSGGQSTLVDGESGLPPVVTGTGSEGGRASASASASGDGNAGENGSGGQGNGGGDVSSIDSPAGSGAEGLRIQSRAGDLVVLVVVGYVMFI